MPINYKVERSIGGLTQAELNTLGESNWDLQTILEENIGYQYIFTEGDAVVEYQVAFAISGLAESQIQVFGNNDFILAATLSPGKSIGTYYYFKR